MVGGMTPEMQRPQPGGLAELGSTGAIGVRGHSTADDALIRHSQPKVNNRQWERLGGYAIGHGPFTVSWSGDSVFLAWRVSKRILSGNRREMPALLGAFLNVDEAKAACVSHAS